MDESFVLVPAPRYDARLRAALSHMTRRRFAGSEAPLALVEQEVVVQAKGVVARVPEQRLSCSSTGRGLRALKIGLAAIIGGGVMAVTAGLAAPMVLSFGYLTAAAAAIGVSGPTLLSTAAGIVGATVASSSVAKKTPFRTAGVEEFLVHFVRQVPSLHSIILVPGWLSVSPGDPTTPEALCGTLGAELERAAGPYGDLGVLLCEPRLLTKLGSIVVEANKWSRDTTDPRTPRDLHSGITGPWKELETRVENCSKLLADGLIHSEISGARPISLIGFGLGATIIFRCLERLAAAGIDEHRGLVQNAVLVCSTVPSCQQERWMSVRDVVPGRLANVFVPGDAVLRLVCGIPADTPRHKRCVAAEVAGLGPVCESSSDAFVENVDAMATTDTRSSLSISSTGVLSDIIRSLHLF
jgi:hypothetical protein